LNKILNIKSALDESANQFFFELSRHLLKTRRNGDGKYNDFVQLLIEAEKNKVQTRDENDVNEAHYINEGQSCLFFSNIIVIMLLTYDIDYLYLCFAQFKLNTNHNSH
jgi:hypothetical protein